MTNKLLGTLAISAIVGISGAACSQGVRENAPSSPQRGEAPGVQRNQQDAPTGQGQPSGRAQERTGMEGGPTTKPGAATNVKPRDTSAKPESGMKAGETAKPPTTVTEPAGHGEAGGWSKVRRQQRQTRQQGRC